MWALGKTADNLGLSSELYKKPVHHGELFLSWHLDVTVILHFFLPNLTVSVIAQSAFLCIVVNIAKLKME